MAQNISSGNLVVIDIRSSEAYGGSHIPGAISAPFQFPVSVWITERDGLFLEVPDKAGHIPMAASLPAPWIWTLNPNDGTYRFKDPNTLAAMAAGVLSTPPESPGARQSKDGEIIVYCGVGGYASSWWFILTQVLGFTNVTIYNGAAQQWGLHYDMVAFQWE